MADPAARIEITATLLTAEQAPPGAKIFTTASISPTAGKLVLLFTSNENYSASISEAPASVTGAGLTFTKINDTIQFPQWTNASLWCACSNTTTTGTITLTHTIDKIDCNWVIIEFDADATAADNGVGALLQIVGQTTGGDNPQTIVTAGLADFENPLNAVAVFGSQSCPDPATSTPSAGVTEISDQVRASGSGWFIHNCSYFKASADKNAGYTNSSGASFNTLAAIAVEIKSIEVPPVPIPAIAGGGGFSRAFYKAHKKHIERMWQETAERNTIETDELETAWNRANGIIAKAAEVMAVPAPAAVPEPILELAKTIPVKPSRQRDRQSAALLKMLSDYVKAMEAEDDEEDIWLLLAA